MTLVRPQKLQWVTIPIIINMVLGVLSLLALPFLGALFNSIFNAGLASGELFTSDPSMVALTQTLTGGMLWVAAIVGIAWLVFEFFTLRAVQQGRNWGRVAAIVIFILSLLSFPLGTLLGIFGLIGAFDEGVQRYASR